MIRAVVVEDLDAVRNKNIALIAAYCPDVTVVATADGVASGAQAIREGAPDLVFLDVELADGTGFDLLEAVQPVRFRVIFITGHGEFAVRAFRFSAVDYLLKPLNPADLVVAVGRVRESLSQEAQETQMSTLLQNIAQPNGPQKLVLKTVERIYSVPVEHIIRCESIDNYTRFYLADGQMLLVSSTLKEYETTLMHAGFFRAHQSHLINMRHFDYYQKGEAAAIILKDKSRIPLASRKKEAFLNLLETL